MIKARWIHEIRGPFRLDTAGVGVRRVPVSTRRHQVAVRWFLQFNLSYRALEQMLVERSVEVDHVTVFRWVQRFTPALADA
jgi:hypothetical protein